MTDGMSASITWRDDELEVYGWYKIRESDELCNLPEAYGAEQQIIDKDGGEEISPCR